MSSSLFKKIALTINRYIVFQNNIKMSTITPAQLQKDRLQTASSIMEFDFIKKRSSKLTNNVVPENAKCVIYWMIRDFRVQDNWSFLLAQRVALKYNLSIEVVVFTEPCFLYPTTRQYNFFLEGLQDVRDECKQLNIGFHMIKAKPFEVIPKLIRDNDCGTLIVDFFPLRQVTGWIDSIVKATPDIPIIRVDSHNIVPTLVASNKMEYSAATIRRKITSLIGDYLTKFPPLIDHKIKNSFKAGKIQTIEEARKNMPNDNMPTIKWAKGGYKAGLENLKNFCEKDLKDYETCRNNPNKDCNSNLSPWLHFGHISAHRCVLVIKEYASKCNLKSILEEITVRRELTDNFCWYNEHYDSIKGAYAWAQETLNKHRSDKRDYIYTKEEFENAKTHEDLWNAAQLQLKNAGKMHGFMRMYWAKKILEWTKSPEEAIEIALYLNDRYSLDGTDPNGFVGVMWSMCGIHDQGWRERDIFGKIRYMNYAGCTRKFDVQEYCRKWGATAVPQNRNKKQKTK